MPDAQQPIDYKSAGVDIEAGNEAVRRMKAHVARTHSPAVLSSLGAFGSLFSLSDAIKGMADPVMVQSTDGVGTKTLVAVMAGRYENLGRDLVAALARRRRRHRGQGRSPAHLPRLSRPPQNRTGDSRGARPRHVRRLRRIQDRAR